MTRKPSVMHWLGKTSTFIKMLNITQKQGQQPRISLIHVHVRNILY